jgi:hypothetical protein
MYYLTKLFIIFRDTRSNTRINCISYKTKQFSINLHSFNISIYGSVFHICICAQYITQSLVSFVEVNIIMKVIEFFQEV